MVPTGSIGPLYKIEPAPKTGVMLDQELHVFASPDSGVYCIDIQNQRRLLSICRSCPDMYVRRQLQWALRARLHLTSCL